MGVSKHVQGGAGVPKPYIRPRWSWGPKATHPPRVRLGSQAGHLQGHELHHHTAPSHHESGPEASGSGARVSPSRKARDSFSEERALVPASEAG